MEAVRQLEIDCSGGRSGSGPATWGQEAIWSAVRDLGADAARYTVTADAPVPPGVPLPLVLESLRRLVLMHDSLRTRLIPEDAGALVQIADACGRVPVLCRGCPAQETAAAGRALVGELAAAPFDAAGQWPVRVGLVQTDGQVRHMAFALAHTAVDAWGLQRMILDLTSIALGESAESIGEQRPALQPLEEAAFQRSARGRRQDASARRHWCEKARLGPARLFAAPPGAPDGPLFPNAVLNSPALCRALRVVAAGRQASSSAVLLAAASAVLCRISGSPDALFQLVVNNRFLPRLTNAVSTVAQEGLFHLPDIGASFPDLVRRAQSASLAVYRSAYYDKALLDRDLDRLSARDGGPGDLSCILNDYRGLRPATARRDDAAGPRPEPGRAPAAADLARALGRTTLTWPVEFEPRRNVTFALDALDAPGSIELAMTADGAVLPRADMERFLIGIEDLVVQDALALVTA